MRQVSISLADDSFGGRHLRRGEKTADVQDFLEMELAGLEPATSWVRFKWPIGLLPPAGDSWSVSDPTGIHGAARRGFWTPNRTPSGKRRRDADRRSYSKHFEKRLSAGTTCEQFEWRGPESNRGHHDFQSCALPTELPRRAAGW